MIESVWDSTAVNDGAVSRRDDIRGLDETDIAPATSPRASGLAPDPVDVMAWIVSWSTLLWMWAGGPLMGVGACLLVYCYCCSGGSGGAKARRRKTTLPL